MSRNAAQFLGRKSSGTADIVKTINKKELRSGTMARRRLTIPGVFAVMMSDLLFAIFSDSTRR
jgi:hypothetical protein